MVEQVRYEVECVVVLDDAQFGSDAQWKRINDGIEAAVKQVAGADWHSSGSGFGARDAQIETPDRESADRLCGLLIETFGSDVSIRVIVTSFDVVQRWPEAVQAAMKARAEAATTERKAGITPEGRVLLKAMSKMGKPIGGSTSARLKDEARARKHAGRVLGGRKARRR